jgi:large subunit ribosomal protein L3
MITGVWGKKVGMTQVFAENKVVPVTAIDTSNWFVTLIKTPERDGYAAIQVGRLRTRYEGQSFSQEWLSDVKKYFLWIREIKHDAATEVTVGQAVSPEMILQTGKLVDVTGTSIGHGFQGVVKRHGFGGGPDSHGSMFHRRPGTMSFMHSRGRVIKGKKLPGQMGCDQRVMKNLQVVQVGPQMVLVKGSVPGKTGSLVYMATIKEA